MEAYGVEEKDLIERAAAAFVKALLAKEQTPAEVWVVAGPGNNGADARSVAALLQEKGSKVTLWDFPATFAHAHWKKEWESALAQLPKETLLIDGLFGSGLSRPLEGAYAYVVERINAWQGRVYAIDVPSGLPGEGRLGADVKPWGPVVKAEATLAFQFPKLAFFLPENHLYVGEWEVLDIGMGAMEYSGIKLPFVTIEGAEEALEFPPKRSPFSHKYDYGHALLLAGSRGKMGAALMAARACMRMGTGLLTVHVPECGECPFYTALPEAMLSVDSRVHIAGDLPKGLKEGTQKYAALGIGPGWGRDPVTVALLKRLLVLLKEKSSQTPCVLDADALYMLSEHPFLMDLLPEGTVLTPHSGEFDRLAVALGLQKATCSYNRIIQAVTLAKKWKVIIVLKGRYTLITEGKKPNMFNTTGNPGMATAGSGDVLTGIILSLLAQGVPSYRAAAIGVFLHGRAGDLAAGIVGDGVAQTASFTATDIINHL